jgi:hypothetical protein
MGIFDNDCGSGLAYNDYQCTYCLYGAGHMDLDGGKSISRGV